MEKKKDIYIVKANGEREIFDISKLEDSLTRAGTSPELVKEISDKIENSLVEGMKTKDIYKKAFSFLIKQEDKTPAAKYSVRRAILDLGPHGFPFEDFVGEIFRARGYQVEVGKTVNGFCVMHEMDVVAQNEKELWMIEIKFHNNVGVKSDLKTALYVKARFDDLEKGDSFKNINEGKLRKRVLLTNTKFSSRAIQYGTCAGLTLIGWNYPHKGNLQDLINETGLHPLTCLTTLTKKEKQEFLNQGIVLCRDLTASDKNILKTMKMTDSRLKEVSDEIKVLCKLD
ncbi:ATPase [Patescibacteria group bacterium]|nr:ATPase [Patescibacteria group bacterium]